MLALVSMHRIKAALVIAIAAVGCDPIGVGAPEQSDPAHEELVARSVRSQPPRPEASPARPLKLESRRGMRSRPVRSKAPPPPSPIESQPQPPAAREGGLAQVASDTLCVTKGALAGSRIAVPTFRAVALGHAGDAAAVKLVVNGASATKRALAGGQERRQVGLKLRAENGCNLVYVMWRLDPKPAIDVSIKLNPGERTAKECGAGGYTKVKPVARERLPVLDDGSEHELRAAIVGDVLDVYVDDQQVWTGTLPAAARDLVGPAGVRSDNLDVDVLGFAVDARQGVEVAPKCTDEHAD